MSPPVEKPLTIRALAARLRLSAMTVSRALRNAPGVSQATRKLVLAAAQNRGYRPDPSLAVLNAYRHGKRHLLPQETIAYLTNFPSPGEWRRVGTFLRYFNGAQARAAELGYALEHFWLGEPDMTGRRASQILLNRGIRGLIVGPLHEGGSSLQLDWDQFTAVALGRSMASPAITTVSTNHFQAVELAWQKVWERGYRRIGLALTDSEDARTAGTLQAAHYLQQKRYGGVEIPSLITADFSAPALMAWADRHQPDLVISSNHRHYELLLEALGVAARRMKFINLNTNPRWEMGGVDQGHDKVGAQAVSLLHLKLVRRETGVPARREITLLDGVWKEGRGEWRLPRRGKRADIDAAPPAVEFRQLSSSV
jgi:LacI family transcriptional regulator